MSMETHIPTQIKISEETVRDIGHNEEVTHVTRIPEREHRKNGKTSI